MNVKESILLAIDSMKVNKLRSFLTLLSISIGVFAIIVAISLVKSINYTVATQMSELGDNTYMIFRIPKIQFGFHTWRKYMSRKYITYKQYREFKKNMINAYAISAYSSSGGHTIKSSSKETNPNVSLIGADADYFITNNINIVDGRQFINEDLLFNRNFAIIGNDIAQALFENTNPIGKIITIKKQKYEVIGLLETKGAILGQSQDNQVIIPLTQFLKYYTEPWEESLNIVVKVNEKSELSKSMDEAIGIMRAIRDQKPWELNSFEIESNDSIVEQFSSFTGFLSIFGIATGFIALIAAGVGIMNIMLVTIKERTREIGIRKAVGAKKRWILTQFLIETITISQIGGFIGIISGLILGSLFGKMLGLTIIFPYDWVFITILICTILGLSFGLYPAMKAANLDPIEALRYE